MMYSGSLSWNANVTPLATSTSRNGPKRVAGESPNTSVQKADADCWSRQYTMVWLSCTAIAADGSTGSGIAFAVVAELGVTLAQRSGDTLAELLQVLPRRPLVERER